MPANLVGVRGFEPPTPCTPCKCATKLRHTPTLRVVELAIPIIRVSGFLVANANSPEKGAVMILDG